MERRGKSDPGVLPADAQGRVRLTRLKNACLLTSVLTAKNSFSEFVPPMMAESAKSPFDSPDWIFEIKLDGYRAITVLDSAGKPHLW
jgi:ATP-dependent DNA ligase